MSDDRICIRGCTKRGIHYATCELSGPDYDGAFPCTGCAPKECREGSFWCDTCFGRTRRLLDDAPDLLARLRSIIDPSKATPLDQVRVRVMSSEPAAAVASDPLDAITNIGEVLGVWESFHRDLQHISNDKTAAEWMGAHVLDRHKPEDGIRQLWSVQDAVDQWGVERVPAKGEHPWEPDDEREEIVTPIPEWGDDSLITKVQAAQVAGSGATLRRWVRRGLLAPTGRIIIAGVGTQWYRYSDVLRVRDAMKENITGGQFKTDRGD